MELTGLLFLFTCQPTKSSNFSRSGVNVRAHLLRKNYSRNFSSIRSTPMIKKRYFVTVCCARTAFLLKICIHIKLYYARVRFALLIAFCETAKDWFCSATKRYIVTYRCIAKCHKALQTLALSNSRQVPSSLYYKDILARYEDMEVVGAGTST